MEFSSLKSAVHMHAFATQARGERGVNWEDAGAECMLLVCICDHHHVCPIGRKDFHDLY